MERRKFTREFKVEAVRLIKERGVSYVQAAQDLGVHQSVLRSWVIFDCFARCAVTGPTGAIETEGAFPVCPHPLAG